MSDLPCVGGGCPGTKPLRVRGTDFRFCKNGKWLPVTPRIKHRPRTKPCDRCCNIDGVNAYVPPDPIPWLETKNLPTLEERQADVVDQWTLTKSTERTETFYPPSFFADNYTRELIKCGEEEKRAERQLLVEKKRKRFKPAFGNRINRGPFLDGYYELKDRTIPNPFQIKTRNAIRKQRNRQHPSRFQTPSNFCEVATTQRFRGSNGPKEIRTAVCAVPGSVPV